MSILLDLPPALEQELAEEAVRLGLPLSDYAVHVLTMRRPARTTARQTAMGKYAHVPGSSDDFAKTKQHDIDADRR